jgi:hypothetical protein
MEQSEFLFKGMLKSKLLLSGQSNEFASRLQPNHCLVTSPHFEMGVVKIMKGVSEGLTADEQVACKCLLKSDWPKLYPIEDEVALNSGDACNSPSSFTKMMKSTAKRPHSETALKSKYIDLSFLSPTTVVVETLSPNARVS